VVVVVERQRQLLVTEAGAHSRGQGAAEQQQQVGKAQVHPQQQPQQQQVAAVAGPGVGSSRMLLWRARQGQQRLGQILRRLGAPLEPCSEPAASGEHCQQVAGVCHVCGRC
jgi:hypothetical protein